MEQYSIRLDGIFQGLADPTRRAVLQRLSRGPASVSELAAPFAISLPSFMKHIRSLESSGWIVTRKQGRVRTCEMQRNALAEADAWLSEQRALWEARFDRLDTWLERKDNA